MKGHEIIVSPVVRKRKEVREETVGYPDILGLSGDELDRTIENPSLVDKIFGVARDEDVEYILKDKATLDQVLDNSPPPSWAERMAYALRFNLDNRESVRGINGGTRYHGDSEVTIISDKGNINTILDYFKGSSPEKDRISGNYVKDFTRELFADRGKDKALVDKLNEEGFDDQKPL